eukprot:9480569-Pyramimonas_sp.AAC.1
MSKLYVFGSREGAAPARFGPSVPRLAPARFGPEVVFNKPRFTRGVSITDIGAPLQSGKELNRGAQGKQ